jgi:hypothetical protein
VVTLKYLPTRLKKILEREAEKRNLSFDQCASALLIEKLNALQIERRKPENAELRSLIKGLSKSAS